MFLTVMKLSRFYFHMITITRKTFCCVFKLDLQLIPIF